VQKVAFCRILNAVLRASGESPAPAHPAMHVSENEFFRNSEFVSRERVDHRTRINCAFLSMNRNQQTRDACTIGLRIQTKYHRRHRR